jgi:hypothetical protein
MGRSEACLYLVDSERAKAIPDPLRRQAFGWQAHSGVQQIVARHDVDEG